MFFIHSYQYIIKSSNGKRKYILILHFLRRIEVYVALYFQKEVEIVGVENPTPEVAKITYNENNLLKRNLGRKELGENTAQENISQ